MTVDRKITLAFLILFSFGIFLGGFAQRILAVSGVSHDFATEIVCNDCIDQRHIATSGVGSNELAPGSVSQTKIAANAIISSLILDGTIVAADIASNTITTTQIKDATITGTDIAINTVSGTNVDSNSVCTGGGGGRGCPNPYSYLGIYVGATPLTYNGNRGGYHDPLGVTGADALCAAAFSNSFGVGAHVCTEDEIARTTRSGTPVPAGVSGWYSSFAYTVRVAGLTQVNDCVGWTSSSSNDYGSIWNGGAKGGNPSIDSCNVAHKLLCCVGFYHGS